jgi:hypothetical protein
MSVRAINAGTAAPVLVATALLATFVLVSHTPGPATPPVATAPDPLVALRHDELAQRAILSTQLRTGTRVPTGSDPWLLARSPQRPTLVWAVGKAGNVWEVDLAQHRWTRVSTLPPDAEPSPRLAAERKRCGDVDVDIDVDVDVSVDVPGSVGVRAQRLWRRVVIQHGDEVATLQREGALFSADVVPGVGDLPTSVVVAGLEDIALDRSMGAFFNIDSTLTRFAVRMGPLRLEEAETINLSDAGVVTPKAIAVWPGPRPTVAVAGAGSGTVAVFDVDADGLKLRGTVDGLLGENDVVFVDADHVVVASPVADAVAVVNIVTDDRVVIAIDDDDMADADAVARLGEALLFTTALAPEQRSDGPHSRFTCEACHPDGGVDGRVHETGRYDAQGRPVVASTKPLFGLFQNPPLFSRAYDQSVAAMVHAEVGVANALSPRGPWTTLYVPIDAPLLRDVVDASEIPDGVSPVLQRQAMIRAFSTTLSAAAAPSAPPPTPPTHAQWDVFSRRCMGCHQPRLFADDASSVVGGAALATLKTTGSLVWGSDARIDVGVRPLVREGGARVSSLRGIGQKRPLLSNGSATSLLGLLRSFRVERRGADHGERDDDVDRHAKDDEMVWHDGPPSRGEPLSEKDVTAIVAVLRSL